MTFLPQSYDNKMLKRSLLLFLLIASLLPAQVEESTGKLDDLGLPKFHYELLNYKDDSSGLTRVDLLVQVPFNALQFVKDGANFRADYSVTASVYDEEKEKLLKENVWNEKVIAQDFDQTHSRSNFNLGLKSFKLKPGDYVFVISVEDKESRKISDTETKFTVREFEGSIDVSDLVFIGSQKIIDGKEKVYPNLSKIVSTSQGKLMVYAEVYADASTLALMTYTIVSKDNKTMVSKTSDKDLQKGVNRITIETDSIALPLDNYRFKLNLEDLNTSKKVSANKIFFSRVDGIPPTITDINKAIDQLVYLATSKELDSIKAGKTTEEKLARFLEFWKAKDPNKATPENEAFNEYYRRVEYANVHFSHYTEGWKSDMGMVYIILGAPNSVERHPFEYDSKPYEIWEYYQINRSFIFVDNTGFGDYRLTMPFYNDLNRYR